jgi:hypothetical protein
LVKKLTAAWEKKNSKTARAGGVSLMALSLAACGDDDTTPFSQADVDAAVAAVDITSDNTDVMLSQAEYDAAIATATTSNDADIAAAAKTEALTAADGTVYASVDAAKTAGINTSSADAIKAALTDANGVEHNSVDAAITSNDTAISTAATSAAEAALVAGSGFSSVADLLAAYTAAVAPDAAASLSLTTSSDRFVEQFTGVSDTVTGAYGSVNAGDIIIDSYTTDSDVANLTVASNIQVTIANIETINIDGRGDADASTAFVVDAVNMSGYNTLNVDSTYGETKFTIEDAAIGSTLVVDSTATDVTVDLNRSGSSEGFADAMTISFTGDVTANLDKGSTDDVDILTIHSTGAKKNTITLADQDYVDSGASDDDQIIVTGDQTLVLVSDNDTDAKFLDGAIVTNSGTGSLQIKLTGTTDLVGAEIDLDSVDGEIVLALPFDTGNATDIKIKDAAVVSTGVADVVASNASITGATAGGSATFNFAHETGNSDVTLAEGGTLTFKSLGTVNIANSATSAIDAGDANIAVDYAGVGNSTDLNIATGAGLTLGNIAAAASRTLDAVAVTGGKDFTSGTIAANSLSADVEDLNVGDLLIEGATQITASKTVTLDQVDNTTANTGSLTVTAAGDITAADAIGKGAVATDFGNVTLTSTGGAVSVEEIDSDGSIALTSAAGKTVDVTANIAAVGTVTITSGLDIDLDSTVAGSTITLTAASTTVNSTIDGNITGNLVLNGDGVTYASVTGNETITGNVTVQGGASLDFDKTGGTTELVTGNVTHTGSGTVKINDLAGTFSGADATGAVTIADTAAGASSITTGSGADSITTGNVAAQINTGAGNDTVDASAVLVANQVIINTGAGNDTITGGVGTTDQLTGGSGTDTFFIANDVDGSFNERITDFEVGSAGDILKFDVSEIDSLDATGTAGDVDMTSTTLVKMDTTDTGTTTHADTNLYVLTGTQYADVAAAVAAMNGASGKSGNVAIDKGIAVVFADTDGHSYVTVLEGDGSNNFSATDAELVRLDGLTHVDLANMTQDNFLIA